MAIDKDIENYLNRLKKAETPGTSEYYSMMSEAELSSFISKTDDVGELEKLYTIIDNELSEEQIKFEKKSDLMKRFEWRQHVQWVEYMEDIKKEILSRIKAIKREELARILRGELVAEGMVRKGS